MKYFVYVNKLIGVETNQNHFKWNFGSFAPESTYQAFSECLIRIKLNICKEKELFGEAKEHKLDGRFRRFGINENEVSFRQKIGFINFGYRVTILDNLIEANVGKNYYLWVKYKIMNVHPIWYVLYDIVSCLLLKSNLMVLYGSAVETEPGKATVFMGAPGVGKTITATTLCKTKKFKMIAEDLLITDGQKVWPVPYTDTYRGDCNSNGISFTDNPSQIEKIILLEQGCKSEISKEELLHKAVLLNRYNVLFYSSPTMIAYNYYKPDFSLDTLFETEKQIFDKMFGAIKCCSLHSDNPVSFVNEYLNSESSVR